jgi:thiosulfate dehydrogenase
MTAKRSKVSVPAAFWLSVLLVCGLAAGCSARHPVVAAGSNTGHRQPAAESLAAKGELVFDRTPKYAAPYVGNQLACADCHSDSGKAAYAAPMIDLAGLFPMFNKRAGHVISLKERIQECFVRSENGQPPPPDSPEMLALVAYIDSLSAGQKHGKAFAGRGLVKLPELKGDPARGKLVYVQASCSTCHGTDGAGVPPFLPPLWGPGSFNDGAGMDKPAKMAAFVDHNMPQNHPGSLTAQQAYDVTAYVQKMPRPKFNQAYKSY